MPGSECSSLTGRFALERETLQSIVGVNFAVAEFGKERKGQLNISVHDCPRSVIAGKSILNTGFAVFTVVLEKENSPVAIAGLSVDELASLVLFVGPAQAELSGYMGDSAFAVAEGETALIRKPQIDGERLTAEVAFDSGRLRISALFACEEVPFRQSRILAGTGNKRFSLVFGETAGKRCSSSDVDVELAGNTPLSDLDFNEVEATAWQATSVSWNYTVLRNTEF